MDLLLILSANLKTLVLLPLLGVFFALGWIAWQTNQTKIYTSNTTLFVETPTATGEVPKLRSEVVVSHINSGNEFASLAKNNQSISASFSPKDRLVSVLASASSPEEAQALNHTVLKRLYEMTAPKGSEAGRLHKLLKNEQERLSEVHALLRDASPATKDSAVNVRTYGELLEIASAREFAIAKIESELSGLSTSNIVMGPTFPATAQPVKKLMPLLAGLIGGGFLALLWIFVQHALTTLRKDPESRQKLNQIKANIGWR